MLSPLLHRIARLALVPLVVGACAERLSLDNYNKLKVGESYDEVKKIVGDPASCDEAFGVRSCVWGNADRGFSVGFVAGKALLLSATNLK